jgi:hypothetical protein
VARYRNKDAVELQLRLIGDNFTRTVGPDEVVDVPDEIAVKYAWPESVWEPVAEPKQSVPVATANAESGE